MIPLFCFLWKEQSDKKERKKCIDSKCTQEAERKCHDSFINHKIQPENEGWLTRQKVEVRYYALFFPIFFIDFSLNLMPCPFTDPKMFCAGPNFFELDQKFHCI